MSSPLLTWPFWATAATTWMWRRGRKAARRSAGDRLAAMYGRLGLSHAMDGGEPFRAAGASGYQHRVRPARRGRGEPHRRGEHVNVAERAGGVVGDRLPRGGCVAVVRAGRGQRPQRA